MKKVILFIVLLTCSGLHAQKFITKTGETHFKASVEAFEPVEAINKNTTAILNAVNGDVAALIFIRSFHFEIALMEEHFNENYMDSDKHPKATFKGSLSEFELDKLLKQEQSYPLSGTLTIKGIERQIATTAILLKKDDMIEVKAQFEVKPEDFEIEIPKLVREKIAKSIIVTLKYELHAKI